eukprot:SAG11_NODE_16132_length_556_cov_0.792123_1_plen_83_part_01
MDPITAAVLIGVGVVVAAAATAAAVGHFMRSTKVQLHTKQGCKFELVTILTLNLLQVLLEPATLRGREAGRGGRQGRAGARGR